MEPKELSDRVGELTRKLKVRVMGGKEQIIEDVNKLLDKDYKGPIIIVYGDEMTYRGRNPRDGEAYMLFIHKKQLPTSFD